MRSPVTALVEQYNALSEVEQKVFLDLVDPQPEPEPVAKQTRKKRGRSARAQSLSTAIQGTLSKPLETQSTDKSGGDEDLTQRAGRCTACGNDEDYVDHFQPSPHYHPFAQPTPAVGKRSSRKGARTGLTQNIEAGTESVLSASSGGD